MIKINSGSSYRCRHITVHRIPQGINKLAENQFLYLGMIVNAICVRALALVCVWSEVDVAIITVCVCVCVCVCV